MKRILILSLLLINSCQSVSGDKKMQYIPMTDAFKVSESCPNVCWLGIQPGKTSISEAEVILKSSDYINRDKLFTVSETELRTIWFTENTKKYYSRISLFFKDNVVTSIKFNLMAPFRVKDLISLFGEPNTIFIKLDHTIDGGDLVNYEMYFSSHKISLSVYPGSWDGPNSEDGVRGLVLYEKPTYYTAYNQGDEQPWLGYGHLKDYLPGQKLPRGPYTGPPVP